eukprot:5967134-Prymnesium_polylepis.1
MVASRQALPMQKPLSVAHPAVLEEAINVLSSSIVRAGVWLEAGWMESEEDVDMLLSNLLRGGGALASARNLHLLHIWLVAHGDHQLIGSLRHGAGARLLTRCVEHCSIVSELGGCDSVLA